MILLLYKFCEVASIELEKKGLKYIPLYWAWDHHHHSWGCSVWRGQTVSGSLFCWPFPLSWELQTSVCCVLGWHRQIWVCTVAHTRLHNAEDTKKLSICLVADVFSWIHWSSGLPFQGSEGIQNTLIIIICTPCTCTYTLGCWESIWKYNIKLRFIKVLNTFRSNSTQVLPTMQWQTALFQLLK